MCSPSSIAPLPRGIFFYAWRVRPKAQVCLGAHESQPGIGVAGYDRAKRGCAKSLDRQQDQPQPLNVAQQSSYRPFRQHQHRLAVRRRRSLDSHRYRYKANGEWLERDPSSVGGPADQTVRMCLTVVSVQIQTCLLVSPLNYRDRGKYRFLIDYQACDRIFLSIEHQNRQAFWCALHW